MKSLFVVANWKENKTSEEALAFLNEFRSIYVPRENIEVIICPSFLSVVQVSTFVRSSNLNVKIGVQNISVFEEGAHTGEISAREAKEFSEFAIIGHSERRAMGETDEDVRLKTELAMKYQIKPIVCVTNENIPIPSGVQMVAYEPVEAIGTGHPDTPENANKVAASIKSKNSEVSVVLYGGSVTAENVATFAEMENINGILVGGASLDPSAFASLIKAC